VSDLVACPACCASMDPVVADSVAYPSSPGTDSVSRPERVLYCPACGLGIAWPRISDAELDAYYTQGGYWDATGEPELLVPKLHPGHFALAQARWAFAQSAMSSGPARLSVLDIGAGHGFFGMVVSRDVYVDLSRYVAVESDGHLRASLERSWPRFAPRGALSTASDLSDVEGPFDLIVLSNILEHLNDPKGLLETVSGLLADDGVVFADVPCRDERFKADVFPHVLFFGSSSLNVLFKCTGFSVERVRVFGHPPVSSPIAAANERRFVGLLTTRLYGLRRLLPEAASVGWFARHYGVAASGDDGTWVRLVARAKKSG